MQRTGTYRRLFFFALDLLLLNLAFNLGFFARFGLTLFGPHDTLPWAPSYRYIPLEIVANLGWIAGAFFVRSRSQNNSEWMILAKTIFFMTACSFVFIVVQGGMNYSRLFLLYFLTLTGSLTVMCRLVFGSAFSLGSNASDVLVVGAGKVGERFYENVKTNPTMGYRVIGFLDDNGVTSNVRPMILGTLGDLDRITAEQKIDEVIIALPKTSEERLGNLIARCEDKFIRVSVIPNDYAALEGKRVIAEVGEFSLVRVRETPLEKPSNTFFKRAFDIVFSLLMLIVVLPIVFIVVAPIIALTSRGPIFFRQLRTGLSGKPFYCYKFRTMRHKNGKAIDPTQAMRGDPRLTRIGKILRRTNLDELPQFWNVLRGEMSVVGPRPHMVEHTEDYRKVIGSYMVRHLVNPGVTGWAQVNGLRGATETPEKMRDRVRFDTYYIENWSFLFDIKIIFMTVGRMIRGDKNAY